MKQYLDLMREILESGDIKDPARENMPRTKELFHRTMRFNLQDGFPLLTTKKMYTKGVIEELLWFLRGSTNVAELISKGCNIWNEDVFKYQTKKQRDLGHFIHSDIENWKNDVTGDFDWNNEWNFHLYDAGKIYGYHWRNWGHEANIDGNGLEIKGVDQIQNLLNTILKTPNSRYQVVTAWNPKVVQNNDCALPSCHILFFTNVREGKYLDLSIIQRSCDWCLGIPFNVASYALLIHIFAFLTGYEPGELIWTGISNHIYENQIEGSLEQLKREPGKLPTLEIVNIGEEVMNIIKSSKENKSYTFDDLTTIFTAFSFNNFLIENYNPEQTIHFPLSTGLNKPEIITTFEELKL
jgi:thymidylate synthase